MTTSTRTKTPALTDSYGQLMRCRTFGATSIHTPKPADPSRTLCGGRVAALSEWPCSGTDEKPCQYLEQHNDHGNHQADMTVCAGDDPQLCIRCEKSLAARHTVPAAPVVIGGWAGADDVTNRAEEVVNAWPIGGRLAGRTDLDAGTVNTRTAGFIARRAPGFAIFQEGGKRYLRHA